MYLRGNRWTMTRKTRRRPNILRIVILLSLIGVALYFSEKVLSEQIPPLFIPTPTSTQSPESFVNQAEEFYSEGKLTLAITAYKEAISSDPDNAANYIALARLQVFSGQYDEAVENAQNALLINSENPMAHAVQGWALGFQEKYGEAEREIQKALTARFGTYLQHLLLPVNNGLKKLQKNLELSQKSRSLRNLLCGFWEFLIQ